MSPLLLLGVAIGGGIGSVVRYGINRLGTEGGLPWPTLVANIAGSAVLGAAARLASDGGLSNAGLIIVGGGLAGGLTTFSTFAVDAVVLWRSRRRIEAVSYLVLSVAASAASAAVGWWLAGAGT